MAANGDRLEAAGFAFAAPACAANWSGPRSSTAFRADLVPL